MKTCRECVAEINAKLGDYFECYDAYQMVDQLFDFDETAGGLIEKIDPPDFWSVARDSTIIGRLAVDAWDGPACYEIKYINSETLDIDDDATYCESLEDLAFFLSCAYKKSDEFNIPYAVTVC